MAAIVSAADDGSLTYEELCAAVPYLEACRAAYQRVAELPQGHPKRRGIPQATLEEILACFDDLIGSLDAWQ